MSKNYEEAYDLLENMAANNYQWPTSRMHQPRAVGKLELDAVSALSAQMTAQFSAINKRIDALSMQTVQKVTAICEICTGNHPSEQCAINN